MNISILGIGWVSNKGYGCLRQGLNFKYEGSDGVNRLHKKGIFSYTFKNYARLDKASKMTCCAAALALRDAKVPYSMNRKQDIGIVATNSLGSLNADRVYFKDYLDLGRRLARGNLFIYTLPTSPLGEAAIHFGLQGPLLYVAASCKSLAGVVKLAAEKIAFAETPMMLGGMAGEDEAIYFVLAKESGQAALCGIADAVSILENDMGFSDMIRQFATMKQVTSMEASK